MLSKYGGSVSTRSTLPVFMLDRSRLSHCKIEAAEKTDSLPTLLEADRAARERRTWLAAFGKVPRPVPSIQGLSSTGRGTCRKARIENRGARRRHPNAYCVIMQFVVRWSLKASANPSRTSFGSCRMASASSDRCSSCRELKSCVYKRYP
jgi:hypothetical protein